MEEKIIELVNSSTLNVMQKIWAKRLIVKAIDTEEKEQKDKELIKEISREKNNFEVLLSTDEVKIYKIEGAKDWDLKYPYRSIYLDEQGNWRRTATVSPNLDYALLTYLQYSKLGEDNEFVTFAAKMLEMPTNFE